VSTPDSAAPGTGPGPSPGTAPRPGTGPDPGPDAGPESDPDLAGLAAGTPAPEASAAETAATRLGVPSSPGLGSPYGALGHLVVWWAGVSGDPRARRPRTVVHLHSPAVTPPGPAPDAVRQVPLAPPRDIVEAIASGAATADALADEGVDLVLLSLGDPVPARVLSAHLLRLDPVAANAWPQDSGLDDAGWMAQVVAVRDGLRALKDLRRRTGRTLVVLDDPECAAATALLLRCAARRTPVLLDGPGAAAVALLARRSAPVAASWWYAGHRGRHPVHGNLLRALYLDPLLDLGIGVEDGTGVYAALALLDLAAGLLTADRLGSGPLGSRPLGSGPLGSGPPGAGPLGSGPPDASEVPR
jgi:nicotinate-nucleotide--dimethylbenzimidazole phosphoribosyltransferase